MGPTNRPGLDLTAACCNANHKNYTTAGQKYFKTIYQAAGLKKQAGELFIVIPHAGYLLKY